MKPSQCCGSKLITGGDALSSMYRGTITSQRPRPFHCVPLSFRIGTNDADCLLNVGQLASKHLGGALAIAILWE